MAQRGPYAKGVAKREEILQAALEVLARNGYRRTSVREVAEAVGLSQAGLLHYFGSKSELFTEIVYKRDEDDAAVLERDDLDVFEALLEVVRHTVEAPGLMQLRAQLSAAAADADHPMHDFLAERAQRFRRMIAELVRRRQTSGEVDPALDAEEIATILFAAVDGLQTLRALDPELDVAGHLATLLGLVGIRVSLPPRAATR